MKVALCGVSLLALTAYADAIQSWRTPNGSLYFGDHPPPGSTLLTTYAETPRESAIDTPPAASDLSRDAAEGREIIRRRDEERTAERQRELEDDERQQEVYVEPAYWEPYWIVGTSVPCTVGVDCVDHVHHHGDHGDHHHHPHGSGSNWRRTDGNFRTQSQARAGGGIMRPAPQPPPPVIRFAPGAGTAGTGGGQVSPFRH